MHNIKDIRKDIDLFENSLKKRFLEVDLKKILELDDENRKLIQKKQISIVSKIIQNVKKNGDKAVINYEKKFSKIKPNSNNIVFTKKEINTLS